MVTKGKIISKKFLLFSGIGVLLIALITAIVIYRWPRSYSFTIDNMYSLTIEEHKDVMPPEGDIGPASVQMKRYRYLFSPDIYEGKVTIDGKTFSFDNHPTGLKEYSWGKFTQNIEDKKKQKDRDTIHCDTSQYDESNITSVRMDFNKEFTKLQLWIFKHEKSTDDDFKVSSVYNCYGPASTYGEALELNHYFWNIE